jgi:CRISPR-associated protein Csd2
MSAIQNRYDFVYLFDVENGNPNGDPDAGNLPRLDPETNFGLVTDVCLKRKIRNFVLFSKSEEAFFEIFIKEKEILNNMIQRPYKEDQATKDALFQWDAWKKNKKNPKPAKHYEDIAKDWMCRQYFDIRTFGAVMSTGGSEDSDEGASKIRKTAGQVRGPVQLSFARSIEPIVPLEITITRMAVATEREAEAQGGDNRTMGRKHIVPYGLYRTHGFVSAPFAQQTGFSDGDLNLLWEALINMFEHDHSAARGQMNARKLIVFKHGSKLGNAPSHKLFDLVKVERASDAGTPARSFADYKVTVDTSVPAGVTIEQKI